MLNMRSVSSVAHPLVEIADGRLHDHAEVIQTGIAPLDRLLPRGGIVCGTISQLSGPHSSGKRTLAMSLCVQVLAREGTALWVDTPHHFYPLHAVLAGLLRNRMLVVRPPSLQAALRAADLTLRVGQGVDLIVVDLSEHATVVAAKLKRLQLAAMQSGAAVLFINDGTPSYSLGSAVMLHLNVRRLVQQHGQFAMDINVQKCRYGQVNDHARVCCDGTHPLCMGATV